MNEIVMGADVGDHRWNKKAGVDIFYFLYWEYLLLLVSVFGTVGVLFFVNIQIVMNQYFTSRFDN